MTSMDLFPAIHSVSIRSSKEDGDNNVIKFEKEGDTEIILNFSLTGMNKIIIPITNIRPTFYLYIYLAYQNGGKDFEIISSADIYCDEDLINYENLNFETVLDIPANKIYSEDFILNFYYLNIAYSERAVEDGSDINTLLHRQDNSLFRTKLNITSEVE